MFNNRKIEIRLKKDGNESTVEKEPLFTKEEVVHYATTAGKMVIGGILIVLAGAATIDTAKFGAMTAIEDRSHRKRKEI
jgi:hypothetical protein